MSEVSINLPQESDSIRVATRIAHHLTSPLILAFSGDIGTGKTTFIRAMLKAQGVRTAVKSPTFSLVESYECQKFQLHHFDLYRVHDETELEYIGFKDYFQNASVCCIEWAEHAKNLLKTNDLHFNFFIKGEGRLLNITASSPSGEMILSCLAGDK